MVNVFHCSFMIYLTTVSAPDVSNDGMVNEKWILNYSKGNHCGLISLRCLQGWANEENHDKFLSG
jgi:hypothetical protein